MIKVEFNIWTWKDYKKWFWDMFCFPRRKTITEWLDIFSSDVHTEAVNSYVSNCGYTDLSDFIDRAQCGEHIALENFEKDLIERRKQLTKKYVDIILKCK